MDPKRIGCPHNLTELSYLEPTEFAAASKVAQMVYEYRPENNTYTFIVRDKSFHAFIFDWRFASENGVDFREVKVNTWGKDSIINPPNFPGPWNSLSEWNK